MPVMNFACSEQKNATAAPKSSEDPVIRAGIFFAADSLSGTIFATLSVQ